ncbi:DUF4139 domain-containing protein [Rhodanobacter sp. DHB23]|uniref:DUF4139 domain-containing protein n=1 Tax=Rhodanobacter sp. DHB23 TaxID=2775923 RepID=UPI00177ABA4C|nr:DUF4139 domain-containing protein [Rhodanobacter sp. DHB23]MBD8873034.1 DUF4139 domain-containing protein [Rhodanobacter sp. DHB23]
MNQPALSAVALACIAGLAIATPAGAATPTASGTDITLYRSDNAALYASSGDGNVGDGYAVIRERRTLALQPGVQDITLGDLPDQLDAEALALGFPDGNAKVVSQRLLLGQGGSAALTGLIGREVTVLGDGGEALATGTLKRVGDDGLMIESALGKSALGTTWIRQYAGVRVNGGNFPTGSSLRLRVDAARGGNSEAVLSYPTAGLGWRAAYVATLLPGSACRMQFESRASIANRSGRDWNDAKLTLIAGEPNFAKASTPRPVVMMAAKSFAADAPMPQQAQMDNYRSYTLPAPVDLPDGSVSQAPLYETRSLSCERTNLVESGGTWQPPQPMLGPDFNSGSGNDSIVSTLKFTAFDSLPAGYLRVLTQDSHGTPQFIGEGRINDTPKGSDASIALGTAFDLRATRERTAFHADKAGRTMDETFRITLTNAGDSTRTVTVREHPSRWREWKLASSSAPPSRQTTDTLEFRVDVPANGKAVLDYAVHYTWSTEQNPQP